MVTPGTVSVQAPVEFVRLKRAEYGWISDKNFVKKCHQQSLSLLSFVRKSKLGRSSSSDRKG